ncbi:MAG TPA: CHAT domain-containing protein, partial [Flavisolibacter sp.]|nr:CHAT domain-containing protein [Flavisolibacter sp.]
LQLFINALHEPTDNITSENACNKLFALLLKGVLDKKYSRIIIIPENELNYFPFETLKENGNYLIRDYSFQYQYSTLLLKNEPADFKEATIISFAPFINRDFSDKNVQFGQLNFSEKEIKDLKGNQFVGAEATKKNFLEHIYGKDIVHLATHAVASNNPDKPSFIAFAPWDARLPIDYLLYSPEIYNLSLQNKLVILSACETGYGRLERGEGVMSLTRAFAYAGCPDIITSFWKAEDESTAYISAKFHLYLKKGLPIDLALQRAKNDYLADKSINPRKKQPAYWANLVFIGNYQPLTHSFPSIWLIVFVFGLVLYVFLRRPLKGLLLHKKDFAK